MKANIPDYWEVGKKYLIENDLKLSKIIIFYEDPPLQTKDDMFMTLIRSIVGQQISVKAADTVWGRLMDEIKVISPDNISSKENEKLQSCGLSHRKVEYIKGVSSVWIREYEDIDWEVLGDEEVIEKLTRLKGVGVWTAEMILIFKVYINECFNCRP